MEQAPNNPDLVFAENPRNAVTVSVWETAEDLRHFVLRTVHGKFLKRREEWLVSLSSVVLVVMVTTHCARRAKPMGNANELISQGKRQKTPTRSTHGMW